MKDQVVKSIDLIKGKTRRSYLPIRVVFTALMVIALLAFGSARAYAAPMSLSSQTVVHMGKTMILPQSVYLMSLPPNTPDCTYGIICDYLKAHPQASSDPTLPNCASQAYCDYLIAHTPQGLAVEQSLASILLAENFQPGEGEPQLTVAVPAFVRSGPGGQFYNYGDVPFGFSSQVIGVSQDRAWWVIPMPGSLSPDGMGWIDATSVTTLNIDTSPAEALSCASLSSCGYRAANSQSSAKALMSALGSQTIYGYLSAHTTQSVPVLQPSVVGGSLASVRTGK